jgi:hypothetical protein
MGKQYVNVPACYSRSFLREQLRSKGEHTWATNEILLDKMLFVIELVIRRTIIASYRDEFDFEQIHLKSTYLHKQLGRAGKVSYRDVFEALKSIEIISEDGRYRPGYFSKSFGLIDAIGTDEIKEPLDFWQPLEPKPKRIDESYRLFEKIRSVYRENLSKITIDERRGQLIVESEKEHGKKLYQIYFIRKLVSKNPEDIFCKPDKNERLHHNLTAAPRVLRPAITVDGKPIFSVDISSSQPFFAIKRFIGYVKQKANDKDLDQAFLKYPDAKSYIDDVTSGTFYSKILEFLNADQAALRDIKRNILTAFFGEKDVKRLSGERRAIKALYPTFHEFIRSLKNKDFHNAANTLQQIESDTVIYHAAKRIVEEEPNKWFITVHDSILCMEEDVDYFYNVLYDECTKAVGYSPNIKRGIWSKYTEDATSKKPSAAKIRFDKKRRKMKRIKRRLQLKQLAVAA